MSTTFLSTHVRKAISHLCEDVATPRSLCVKMLFENGEWDQLATLAVDPSNYLDSESYWRDATVTDLLRKCKDLPTTFDRSQVAMDGFFACERSCFRANTRLNPFIYGTYGSEMDRVHEVFLRVQKNLADILGPCPDIFDGRFGPGSTFGDKGNLSTIPDKMSSSPTLTTDAWPFLFQWSGTLWASAVASSGKSPVFVPGNRFTTVPKDACKDRGIAIEPSINVFYQLAVGRFIRKRLLAAGIDLQYGQDRHRLLACNASTEGHLSTLDLSNASDTVSWSLVKLLLPPRWFDLLNSLRSPKTLINGKWVLLEKFSSMGNGFTFELETLIFLCLTQAVSVGQIGVDIFAFGDDLILPTSSSKDVIAFLEFCGMTVNQRKSFVEGPFRESCGGDFFSGVNVRPHFLKESPNEPQQLISLANGLRRSANGILLRDRIVNRAWLRILDGLPSQIRACRGPSSLGDLVIHDSSERWRLRHRNSIRYVRVYRAARFRKVSWQNFKPDVILASACYGTGSGSPLGAGRYWHLSGVTPRDAVQGYKLGWVPYS